DFGRIPDPVRDELGELRFVLEVALAPGRRLSRENADVVRANLVAQGFHLQMPPRPDVDPLTGDWGTDACARARGDVAAEALDAGCRRRRAGPCGRVSRGRLRRPGRVVGAAGVRARPARGPWRVAAGRPRIAPRPAGPGRTVGGGDGRHRAAGGLAA